MKKKLLFVAVLFCVLNTGCKDDDPDFRKLNFWSDKDFSGESFTRLFVNDTYLGDLDMMTNNPSCGSTGTIAYELPIKTDVEISIKNSADESRIIATINVENFSSGINVNTDNRADNTAISFSNDSNDDCTKVYLDW